MEVFYHLIHLNFNCRKQIAELKVQLRKNLEKKENPYKRSRDMDILFIAIHKPEILVRGQTGETKDVKMEKKYDLKLTLITL